jgi:probable DNA repair protein
VRHLAVSDASPCGQVVGCHDADEELRLAAGWARAQAEAAPGRRVAIVMVDHEACGEAARRACLDTLAPGWALYPPATMPVAVTATRPLADFPLIHIALLVLQAGIGELHWRDASQLLRAPCIGGFSRERAARAIVELRLREDCSDSIAAAGLVTRSATEAPEFSARLAAMSAPWPATGSSAGDWSTRFGQRLAASGWPGDRVLSSEEHQALSAWQDLLVEFAAAARVQAALTARDALGILVDMAGSWLFAPAGDEAAVQVVSLRESEGLEFDAVWVAGLSADAWPEPARPDALLELGLQRAAGIPEAVPALQLSRARGRLGRLTASAQAAILSWSARRGDAALTVSPLLSAMPATTASALPVYKGPRHREAVRAAVGSLVEDALDPVRILPSGTHARGGASVLSWQAVCPARAFIESRLNATELRRPRRPLDGRDRGTLVHLLLQHLYSAADCQRGLGELDPDRLRTLFDTAADRAINAVLRAPGPVLARLRGLERVRLWQVTQQMQALDRSRTPFTVEAREQDHRQQLGPLVLSVRIDRVEKLANGQRLVIDYKTGQFSSSGWRGPRPADCQLPLYVVATGSAGCAVLHFQPGSLRLDGVGADDLDIQGLKSPEQFFREPGLTWPAVMQRWQASLQQLAEEFASGDFRIDAEHSEGADGQFAMLTRLHECGVFPGDRNE